MANGRSSLFNGRSCLFQCALVSFWSCGLFSRGRPWLGFCRGGRSAAILIRSRVSIVRRRVRCCWLGRRLLCRRRPVSPSARGRIIAAGRFDRFNATQSIRRRHHAPLTLGCQEFVQGDIDHLLPPLPALSRGEGTRSGPPRRAAGRVHASALARWGHHCLPRRGRLECLEATNSRALKAHQWLERNAPPVICSS